MRDSNERQWVKRVEEIRREYLAEIQPYLNEKVKILERSGIRVAVSGEGRFLESQHVFTPDQQADWDYLNEKLDGIAERYKMLAAQIAY